MDVNVKHNLMQTAPKEKYDSKKSIKALHVFPANDNKDRCTRDLGGIYNKIQHPFLMNRNIPKGR